MENSLILDGHDTVKVRKVVELRLVEVAADGTETVSNVPKHNMQQTERVIAATKTNSVHKYAERVPKS